ncbi:MAG: hypothetical protein AB1394_11570 [Bacteroidota bacterium]
MLGLYYAIIGLFSGALCSYIASKKSRNQKDWFTLGQVLPVVSVISLLLLPGKNAIETSGKCYRQTFESDPLLETLSQ